MKNASSRLRILLFTVLSIYLQISLFAQNAQDTVWKESTFSGLPFRSVGPALMAGRIADIAIHPENSNTWYVAVGSGGVWKTNNAAITWEPLFDKQAVFSTGCISIDPSEPSTIWVGTGENVGGRHVGFGDGIYKSTDDGKSWTNMGLKNSEHISKIIIHPENSNIIWVAVQGPLWSKGGQRGVYKSVDGGKSWENVLSVNDWTGATDLVIHPDNPEVLYAATWQRHRTTAAYLGGGLGSGLHKSTDGGTTWMELKNGLPAKPYGKIGLTISPQKPDVLYAAIELNQREGGVFVSENNGNSWGKRSSAISGATGPHYYQELYACPHNYNRIYLMDYRVQVSDDGGRNFRRLKEKNKHSDNHAMAFKKNDPNYILMGTDGGLYESFDLASNWRFIANMPITQFYKLAVDDSKPFYKIYGGTQDNSTQGGPSRTDNLQGVQNSDWQVVLNWDGHQPAVEPGNPDVVYGQRQEGTLARIDMRNGNVVDIQPQAAPGEPAERFNWDAPIFISPHSPTRLYFASQRLWKSEDRGNSWESISPDLTKNQNRIELPIGGKTQSWDNAWDLYAMSNFNTITSISESPIQEGLLYIGTDDGHIQISENGGQDWKKLNVSSLPGVPETAYINNIMADLFDANTVYIALDNHKSGDFKPYLFKSTNKGKSWTSMTSNLPEKHLVWRLVQDHIDKNLFFIGTEFGVFFSSDAGAKWMKLKGGMPTIAIRDLTIQRRENDLVLATFGRSFYIFDDISVFRNLNETKLKEAASLYSIRDAWWYIPRSKMSFEKGAANQGAGHYYAENPEFGACFTYHISADYSSLKEKRAKEEVTLEKSNATLTFPGWDALSKEETEQEIKLWFIVKNEAGNVVRHLAADKSKGLHRTQWDLRHPPIRSLRLGVKPNAEDQGILVSPGNYSVELAKEENGVWETIATAQNFVVKPLHPDLYNEYDEKNRESFWAEIREVIRQNSTIDAEMTHLRKSVETLETAQIQAPQASAAFTDLSSTRKEFDRMQLELYGNSARSKVGEKNPATLSDRLSKLYLSFWNSTAGPSPQTIQTLEWAKSDLMKFQTEISALKIEVDTMTRQVYELGGPHIEGR